MADRVCRHQRTRHQLWPHDPIARPCNCRARDEGADGFVLAIRDPQHGLSFWNDDTGFDRLSRARVFSEAEAANHNVPLAHDQPEWLAMPEPLRL